MVKLHRTLKAMRLLALILLSLALALPLVGCGCGKEVEPEANMQEDDGRMAVAARCPAFVDVQDRFGLSLGGVYGGATLAEYRVTTGQNGQTRVVPPIESACALDIAKRLEQACDLCKTQPDSCLELVTTIVGIPTSVCATCGDGRCTAPSEDAASCGEDCRCGNGSCEIWAGESIETCPEDCAGTCGDRFCAAPLEACGCEEGVEGCVDCPQDCCFAVCGDGRCEADSGEADEEGPGWCEIDCGAGFCGDDVCQATENSANCAADCAFLVSCGDGLCASPETCFNCPEDCSRNSVCLDGICSTCELWTCAADCGGLDFECGDGVCAGIESPINCPLDCVEDTTGCGDGTCDLGAGEDAANCADCATAYDVWCDGYCSDGEITAGIPEECQGDCRSCSGLNGTCISTEVTCTTFQPEMAGPFVGGVLRCGENARCGETPELEVCEGACRYIEGGAECTLCPAIHPDTMGIIELCPADFEPYCVGSSTLRTCGVDPTYTSEEACATVQTVFCATGCVEEPGQPAECDRTPFIFNITPPRAPVGASITLSGALFRNPGTLTFSPGVEAPIVSWSDEEIVARVPDGAVSGEVTLVNSEGGETARPFDIVTDLTIVGLDPPSGEIGTEVTINGFFFGAAQGRVLFTNDVEASIVSWSDTRIVARAPIGAVTGEVTVETSGGAQTVSDGRFTIGESIPEGLLLSVTSGDVGDTVEITGRGFGGGGEVLFWVGGTQTIEQNHMLGAPAPIVEWTPTRIVVTVPGVCHLDAMDMEICSRDHNVPVIVKTTDGFASSGQLFALNPFVGSVAACGGLPSGIEGDIVTMEGAGFGYGQDVQVTSIRFSPGVEAPILSVESYTLQTLVPPGATSGPITLVTESGEITSEAFSVLSVPGTPTTPLAGWPVSDSGTAFCTDGAFIVECDAAQAQDGTRLDPAPDYIENGNIIEDNVTGLKWLTPSPMLQKGPAQCYCREQTEGGLMWRLPNVNELMSTVDWGQPTTHSFDPVFAPVEEAIGYWTSFIDGGNRPTGYTFVNTNGTLTLGQTDEFRVSARCVNAAPSTLPEPRFTTTDDTFTDVVTGLTFTRQTTAGMAWSSALTYCDGLELEGQTDWRLPSAKELTTVMDFDDVPPDPAPFGDFSAVFNVWTSTPANQVRGSTYDLVVIARPGVDGGLWLLTYSAAAGQWGVVCVR